MDRKAGGSSRADQRRAGSGIEGIIAARRSEGLPSYEELRQRLATLTAQSTSHKSTPGDVFAVDAELDASGGLWRGSARHTAAGCTKQPECFVLSARYDV